MRLAGWFTDQEPDEAEETVPVPEPDGFIDPELVPEHGPVPEPGPVPEGGSGTGDWFWNSVTGSGTGISEPQGSGTRVAEPGDYGTQFSVPEFSFGGEVPEPGDGPVPEPGAGGEDEGRGSGTGRFRVPDGRAMARQLAADASGSALLGAGPGGFLDAVAHPRPSTYREHFAYVKGHKDRPGEPLAAAIFDAVYLLLTLPPKVVGKTLTGAGKAMTLAGEEIDQAGNRAVVIITIAAVIIAAFVVTMKYA